MRCGNRGRDVTTVAVLLHCACALIVAASVVADVTAAAGGALVERQRYAMGTMFAVVVRVPDGDAAAGGAAADAALDEVWRLDRVLSHYAASSDLSQLAAHGARGPVQVDSDLYRVIEQSLEVAKLSQGRFDITVGPYVRLWRDARERGRQPDRAELVRAAACTGTNRITLHPPDRVALHADCMALDLGGIGKGYAVDRAIDVLRRRGIEHAVINAGSSTILAIGSAGDGEGWPVAPLWGASTGGDTMRLRDMALATSVASGELIVPARREPSASTHGVTVTMPTATMADALSTALLLSTLDEGRAMLRGLPATTAWWTSADGTVLATSRPTARWLGPVGATRW